ncbi:hypothetical protein J5N97_014897 [Dioscorea zingiberensis]|uniref:DUF4378 domain-containing protein n=1 Tax=Dioscorea zingiberensis TaxID=325984 RepID=A0A9D5CUB7_9LILI|nr:hypothetical protein J5N97_014897 [Dioscorea zingiberensis]
MEWIGYGGKQRSKREGSGAGRKEIAAPERKPVSRGRDSLDRARGEGSDRFRKRIYASNIPEDFNSGNGLPVQENSFPLEFRQNSYRRTGGTPIRTLIDEEISKESEIRRHSPSLIARLMGLDTLPAHAVQKKHDVMDTCPPHASFGGFEDKHVSFDNQSVQKCVDEREDFKDVFEIAETSKSEKQKNLSLRRRVSYPKRHESKFMDAEYLSTVEILQKPNDLDDMLEVSDPNQDPFLKFLQEPNSLFSKHLKELKCSPPPHASHITILQSSRPRDIKHSEVCPRSERNGRRRARILIEDIAYFRKPAIRYDSYSLKEHKSPLAHMLSKSDYGIKADGCTQPTQIVVLKPCFSKDSKMARTVNLPRYDEDHHLYKQREETLMSVIQEVHAKGRALRQSHDDMEFMGHRTQGSRDIAREITEQMRRSINYSNGEAFSSQMKRKKRTGRSCVVSERVNDEAFQCASNHLNTLKDNSSSSSSYSSKTSVIREAKMRLSEKGKMTRQSQEAGLVDKASGTLEEMLALSVRETPHAFLHGFANKKDERLAKYRLIRRHGFSYDLQCNDGWEERCSRTLQRSVSVPASSSVYASSEPRARCKDAENDDCYIPNDVFNRRADDFFPEANDQAGSYSCRSFRYKRNRTPLVEEKILPEREIHVEELRNRTHRSPYSDKDTICRPSDDFSVPETRTSSHVAHEQMNNAITCEALGKHGVFHDYQNDLMIEETSHLQAEQPISANLHPIESRSPSGPKEAGQPSPVSVLDPISEEENSSSGCFERVCADLKELRRQLRRLKLESLDIYSEQSEMIASDDDDGGECHSITNAGEILQTFKDEADRDFSYLLDVLIDSGVHGADRDMLSDPFCKIEYPVRSNVFDDLEKKYSILDSWPKSERKLLFDLINLVLVEIGSPYRNLHPWIEQTRTFPPLWSHDDLVEKVWQMVVKNRKDLTSNLYDFLEPKWLNLEEDFDMIGMNIEGMLQEDLLEDLVTEFILN